MATRCSSCIQPLKGQDDIPEYLASSKPTRPPRARANWTLEEDYALRKAVEQYDGGKKNWKTIAELVPNRTEVQCLNRWQKVLGTCPSPIKKEGSKPNLKVRGTWTLEEDTALRRAVEQYGGKNWKTIAGLVPNNKTDVQCLHRWQKVLDPSLVKGVWTIEEDEKIKELVGIHGTKKWSLIAYEIPGRIGKQCRERWANHLDPAVKKGKWERWEDERIAELQRTHGNKWALISKDLPGRTDNAIKNRFNSTISRTLKLKKTFEHTNTKVKKAVVPDPETESGINKSYRSHSTTNELRQRAALLKRTNAALVLDACNHSEPWAVPSSFPSYFCPFLASDSSEDKKGLCLSSEEQSDETTIASDSDYEEREDDSSDSDHEEEEEIRYMDDQNLDKEDYELLYNNNYGSAPPKILPFLKGCGGVQATPNLLNCCDEDLGMDECDLEAFLTFLSETKNTSEKKTTCPPPPPPPHPPPTVPMMIMMIPKKSLLNPTPSGGNNNNMLWYRPEGARVYEEEEVASATFLSFSIDNHFFIYSSFLSLFVLFIFSFSLTSFQFFSSGSFLLRFPSVSEEDTSSPSSLRGNFLNDENTPNQSYTRGAESRQLLFSEEDGSPCCSRQACNFVNNPKNFPTSSTFLSPAIVVTPEGDVPLMLPKRDANSYRAVEKSWQFFNEVMYAPPPKKFPPCNRTGESKQLPAVDNQLGLFGHFRISH